VALGSFQPFGERWKMCYLKNVENVKNTPLTLALDVAKYMALGFVNCRVLSQCSCLNGQQ
jgi:hypothetical protein